MRRRESARALSSYRLPDQAASPSGLCCPLSEPSRRHSYRHLTIAAETTARRDHAAEAAVPARCEFAAAVRSAATLQLRVAAVRRQWLELAWGLRRAPGAGHDRRV